MRIMRMFAERQTMNAYSLSDIDITRYPMSVGDLCAMLLNEPHAGKICFSGESWPAEKESKFIESVIVGVSPTFYFDEISVRQWKPLDGNKRIAAINAFITGQLTLTGMEFRTDLEGKTLNDISFPDQRAFRMCSISAYVLRKGSPEWVKAVIRRRLNA